MKSTVDFLIAILKLIPGRNAINPLTFLQKSKRNGAKRCLIPLESLNSSVWIQALTCSKTIKYMDKSFNVEPFEISKPIDMDSSVDLFQKSKRNGAKRCLIPLESPNLLIWIQALTSFRNQREMELFITSFL